MSVKVAVIGPSDIVRKTISEGKDYKNLTFFEYIYSTEAETLELVNNAADNADILLFTGPVPFNIARNNSSVNIPMLYISYSGMAFYRALFSCLKSMKWNSEEKLRFSLDTLLKSKVEEIMEEFGISDYEVFVKEYDDYITSEELVDFHSELYNGGKVDVIITCLTSAYEKMKAKGYPVFRVIPTTICIKEALRLLSLESQNILSRRAQLGVGILKVSKWNYLDNYSPSEYEQQRMKLSMTELFINFCESIKASMKFDDDEYIFYTTRGSIEHVTGQYSNMPLIHQIKEQFSFKVCMGIGYGYSGNEALKNAEEAIKYSAANNKNTCYVMMEDGKVVGPMDTEKPVEFYPRSEDHETIRLAGKSGISVMSLNRILGITKNLGRDSITANEVAEALNITLRSARRILSSLEEAEVVEVVGEEQPAGRGRPRQIYKVKADLGINEE